MTETPEKGLTGLDLLRAPFPAHLIGRLPKPTKKQTEDVRANYNNGIRCSECGGWHHKNVVHLDYVGHAALTDRLLDCDPNWNWNPLALNEQGLPGMSPDGMWIQLTVCGVTRIGFGSAEGKHGGNAIKEIIGDALRNAAMRFGAALDLWHKGDLHEDSIEVKPEWRGPIKKTALKQIIRDLTNELNLLTERDTLEHLQGLWGDAKEALVQSRIDMPDWFVEVEKAKDAAKVKISSGVEK